MRKLICFSNVLIASLLFAGSVYANDVNVTAGMDQNTSDAYFLIGNGIISIERLQKALEDQFAGDEVTVTSIQFNHHSKSILRPKLGSLGPMPAKAIGSIDLAILDDTVHFQTTCVIESSANLRVLKFTNCRNTIGHVPVGDPYSLEPVSLDQLK